MACNPAQMSPFVSGKLSHGPLFSYTSPEVPSFLTSLKGSGATPELRPPSPPPEDEAAEGTQPEQAWAHASTPAFDLRFKLRLFVFIHIMG